jgi:hypothetical protein
MVRACSTNGEKRNTYRVLLGKPEANRPLARPRRTWVDNLFEIHKTKNWMEFFTIFLLFILTANGFLPGDSVLQ